MMNRTWQPRPGWRPGSTKRVPRLSARRRMGTHAGHRRWDPMTVLAPDGIRVHCSKGSAAASSTRFWNMGAGGRPWRLTADGTREAPPPPSAVHTTTTRREMLTMGEAVSYPHPQALAVPVSVGRKPLSPRRTALGRRRLADIGQPRGPPAAAWLLDPLFSRTNCQG